MTDSKVRRCPPEPYTDGVYCPDDVYISVKFKVKREELEKEVTSSNSKVVSTFD